MPGAPRPNKKAMKIFYKIMKTPKEQRQDKIQLTQKQIREWTADTFTAQ